MTGSALGGGVIFVVAAVLWAVVLVPAWVRRREYRVSERNAIRLQRTLRVLAETAELPEEVRVEATARQALTHEKMMHTAKKQQDAERAAELAHARAQQIHAEARAREARRQEVTVSRAERLRRPAIRRIRGLAAIATVLGILGTLVGAGLLIAGASPALIGWSLLAAVAGTATLLSLAPGRAPARVAAPESAAPPHQEEVAVAPEETPQASSLSPAQHAAAQQAAALRIARARALARARAERPAERQNQPDSMLLTDGSAPRSTSPVSQVAPEPQSSQASQHAKVTPQTRAASQFSLAEQVVRDAGARVGRSSAPESPAQTAARSQQLAMSARLRKMGVVGDTDEGLPDLDAALRRRRNAG